MTDSIEELRDRIRYLEAQLRQTETRDSYRGELIHALSEAGVTTKTMNDALTLIETVAKRNPDGTWYVSDGDYASTTSTTSHLIKRFLERRPHLASKSESSHGDVDDRWPRDANGLKIPASELTLDELDELGGPPPEGWKGERPLQPIGDLDADNPGLEIVGAPEPLTIAPPKDGARYSPQELASM